MAVRPVVSHGLERTAPKPQDPYRELFEGHPIAMLVCDVGTLRILRANARAADLHRTTKSQLEQLTLSDIRSVPERIPMALRREGHGAVLLGFGFHQRQDETSVPVHLVVSETEFEGQPAWLCMLRDLSGILDVSEETQHARGLEALGKLAGGIAHDFNNLLSVILSYTTLLASQVTSESPMLADIQEVRIAAERAAALTKQLLALSRRQQQDPKPLDLNATVRRMENMLRRVIDERIQLSVTLGPNLHAIMGDIGQIERLILNLVTNARDAVAPGGTIAIETRNTEFAAPGPTGVLQPHVMLTVSDTGVGMSPELRARVFEPFFSTKGRDGGTGLGLATVSAIVEQCQGSIWVESEPGRGTRFVMCFPSCMNNSEVEEVVKLPALKRHVESEVVPVVEDNEHLRRTMRSFFTREGYSVLEATNGEEALRLAANFRDTIDLLLTDLVLPGMSGVDVAARLTATRPELKVLYASGYVENAALYPQSANSAFVAKPFDLATFSRVVRSLLDNDGTRRMHDA
jgi:signal transduction histidine kinase/CheY-like chemotaxis protein